MNNPHIPLQHLYAMNPIRVELEITEICNLRCLFCYNDSEPVVASLVQVKLLIDKICEQGVLELVLTGGEPMSHPNFQEIVLYAVQRIPCVMVQTNGTYMSLPDAQFLASNGITGINISFHGIEEDNAILTGCKSSYKSAIQGIQASIEAGLMLWVNTVLTQINEANCVEHLKRLRAIGVKNFTFTRFTPIGSIAQKELLLPPDRTVALLRRIVEFGQQQKANILLANAYPLCGLPEDLRHLAEICTYGLTKFYVDVHGDVLYCGMTRVKIGNILQQSFEEMKKQSDVFIANVSSNLAPLQCRQCPHYPEKCRGGCRAAALAFSNSMAGTDPLSMRT